MARAEWELDMEVAKVVVEVIVGVVDIALVASKLELAAWVVGFVMVAS